MTISRAALAVFLLAACAPKGAREVMITATDYAFQVPDTIAAGVTALGFENRGKVPHEVALAMLRPGITVDSVLSVVKNGGDPTPLSEGMAGILIAEPGVTSYGRLQLDLKPGRTFMMICQFRDSDSLPPHVAMGMYASFHVK